MKERRITVGSWLRECQRRNCTARASFTFHYRDGKPLSDRSKGLCDKHAAETARKYEITCIELKAVRS